MVLLNVETGTLLARIMGCRLTGLPILIHYFEFPWGRSLAGGMTVNSRPAERKFQTGRLLQTCPLVWVASPWCWFYSCNTSLEFISLTSTSCCGSGISRSLFFFVGSSSDKKMVLYDTQSLASYSNPFVFGWAGSWCLHKRGWENESRPYSLLLSLASLVAKGARRMFSPILIFFLKFCSFGTWRNWCLNDFDLCQSCEIV